MQQQVSRQRGWWIGGAIVGATLFGTMAIWQASGTPAMDTAAMSAVAAWHTPVLTAVMKAVTFLGDTPFLTALCLGMLVLLCPRENGVRFAANGALIAGLNNLLKALFARPRPEAALRLAEVSGFSFPSGHAMGSTAIYGFLIYLVWGTRWSRRCKVVLTVALGLLIAAIVCSRVYLRVHYPSDVLGGVGASMLWLSLAIPASNAGVRAWRSRRAAKTE